MFLSCIPLDSGGHYMCGGRSPPHRRLGCHRGRRAAAGARRKTQCASSGFFLKRCCRRLLRSGRNLSRCWKNPAAFHSAARFVSQEGAKVARAGGVTEMRGRSGVPMSLNQHEGLGSVRLRARRKLRRVHGRQVRLAKVRETAVRKDRCAQQLRTRS